MGIRHSGETRFAIPPTRFADARGARLAFQEFGLDVGTAPTVVAVPPMAQNIEAAWERAELRSMFERFGTFCHFIHFDKRGTGVSDRRSQVPGIDERVDDLRAVMDAAEVERAWLFGASEGGPMSLLFAVTYPERVEGLILQGTGAHTAPLDMTEADVADYHERVESMVQQWGTDESRVAAGFAPSLATDPTFVEWHQHYERLSADRDSLRELLHASLEVDVRSILSEIKVPTLVGHRRGDRIIPVEWGQALADAIPHAQFFVTDCDDHFGYAGEREWIDEFERFVTGSVAPRATIIPRPHAQLQTLGRFAAVIDGEVVPTTEWGSRHARQLCKRLVAARGWPVRREELFDLLWPDETDHRKLGARLSVQLSTVRRILGGGVIADRLTVALNLGEVSSDLEVLFGADDAAAVDVYEGEFLPGDVAEDWTCSVRGQALEAFVAAARRLADAASRHDDLTTVIDLARRMIIADQYDESAHKLLVDALRSSGEESDARRAHEHWVDSLAELDVVVAPYA